MRVAILSDIHGNAEALRAVLNDMPADVAEYWILGDLIGYYYQIDEVIKLLKPLSCKYVAGNHEHLFRDSIKNEIVALDYKKKYGSSLEVASRILSSEEILFLTSLPINLQCHYKDRKILLCHGSPWGTDDYVYPDVSQEKLEQYLSLEEDFIFQGHTHYPMKLNIKNKTIINPGSVGQPRNRKAGAHWALFDLQSGEVEFRTTDYSIAKVLEQVDEHDPNNSYLKQVLNRT